MNIKQRKKEPWRIGAFLAGAAAIVWMFAKKRHHHHPCNPAPGAGTAYDRHDCSRQPAEGGAACRRYPAGQMAAG